MNWTPPLRIVGRLVDGTGREIGKIATSESDEALRSALTGQRVAPAFAVLIPGDQNEEGEREEPGDL